MVQTLRTLLRKIIPQSKKKSFHKSIILFIASNDRYGIGMKHHLRRNQSFEDETKRNKDIITNGKLIIYILLFIIRLYYTYTNVMLLVFVFR